MTADKDFEERARLAQSQGRLIITEYPYYPRSRPIQDGAGGRRLTARFTAEHQQYLTTLRSMAPHAETLRSVPRQEEGPTPPYWANDWFPPFDGAALYALIAERRPRQYIEVGSGISTRFARKAVTDLGLSTRIVCIDPHPHNAIEVLADEVVTSRMEDVPPQFWAEIQAKDILFVDNSHRSFPNSDVTVFFTEVLPALRPGVIYGLHDILLPWDYPAEWRDRFYNEQYLLMAYLLGGADTDEILLPLRWASNNPELHNTFGVLWSRKDLFEGVGTHGGAFWMRRGKGT